MRTFTCRSTFLYGYTPHLHTKLLYKQQHIINENNSFWWAKQVFVSDLDHLLSAIFYRILL
jgi:hypothetical protein